MLQRCCHPFCVVHALQFVVVPVVFSITFCLCANPVLVFGTFSLCVFSSCNFYNQRYLLVIQIVWSNLVFRIFRIIIFVYLSIVLRFFSRRFSREKCPTLTVASFSSSFSSDYNLTLIGPLFLQSKLLKLLP